MLGLVREPRKERVSDGDYLAVFANFSLPLPVACFGFSTPLAGPDAGGSSLRRSHRDGGVKKRNEVVGGKKSQSRNRTEKLGRP